MPRDPAGLAPKQLQRVRVLLLWHEAAARAVRVREGDALGVVVDDQVLRQLGEVGQRQGRPPEVLRHEVSVAHGVLFWGVGGWAVESGRVRPGWMIRSPSYLFVRELFVCLAVCLLAAYPVEAG